MIDNLIHVNEDCMTLEQCQQIINFYEDNPQHHHQGVVNVEKGFTIDYDKVKRCTEMYVSVDALNKDNVDDYIPIFENLAEVLESTIEQLKNKYPFLHQLARWDISHSFNIQKYLPNEAYFLLHSENMGLVNGFAERRLIAWMLYLNDVTDGGETEFPTQDIKFKPKAGSMLMWPAYWTHPHRGLPSLTEVKYIATGWFSFIKK
tara:strand:- start:43 stop:654 length:612 start_codon:yes stop_codon:yes gene_type:complete